MNSGGPLLLAKESKTGVSVFRVKDRPGSEYLSNATVCDFHDGDSNFVEGGYYNSSTNDWRPLIEGYIRSEIGIHFHLVGWNNKPVGDTDSTQYCVVIKWPGPSEFARRHLQGGNARWWDDRTLRYLKKNHDALNACAGQVERAVLIGIGEIGEFPEMALTVLPCAKWLYRLDQITGRSANTVQISPCHLVVGGFSQTDRELCVGGRLGPGIVNNELPHEMVQNRTEIMDKLSDKNTPDPRARFSDGCADNYLSRLVVELDRSAIRLCFEKTIDLAAQFSVLCLHPFQLQPDTKERVSHIDAYECSEL